MASKYPARPPCKRSLSAGCGVLNIADHALPHRVGSRPAPLKQPVWVLLSCNLEHRRDLATPRANPREGSG
jgi:hypothetical protein